MIGRPRATVRALRPSDGTTLWSSPNGLGGETSLAAEGNLVALLPSFGPGQTYTIVFLRAADGVVAQLLERR